MAKKRIQAGLTSPADLATRLEKGEEFLSHLGGRVWYNKSNENPFRYGLSPLCNAWSDYALMTIEVEVPWEDSLAAQNILCYLSDTNSRPDSGDYDCIAWIEKYVANRATYPYLTREDIGYHYATPVKPEECYHDHVSD